MDAEHIVDYIMTRAASADRRALFAALQAAVGVIIDLRYMPYRTGDSDPLARVKEALDLGAEVGSPEHLAHVRDKHDG